MFYCDCTAGEHEMEAEENLFQMQIHAHEPSSHARPSLCVRRQKIY